MKKKKRYALMLGLLFLQGCVVMTRRRYDADMALAIEEGELVCSTENLRQSIKLLKAHEKERLDDLEDMAEKAALETNRKLQERERE